MDRNPCPTHLISDLPSEIDEFRTDEHPGAHERTADAIAELIRSETGGKTIGLEGGWGSGKSTVVNLLKARLKLEDGFALMVFDAWAHQGDPLRRTFLENMVQYLLDIDWISDEEKWNRLLEEIRYRKKVTTQENSPQIGFLGKLLAVSLSLVPLGLVLVTGGIEVGVTLGVGLKPNLLFISGLFFTLLPFLILGPCLLLKKGDIWAIWVYQVEPSTTLVTVENPDRTSVEFERDFKDLVKDVLSEDRWLVLVLDNLDRVAPEDALAILSTLQTFLQTDEGSEFQDLDRLWVLIPYDPSGLERLWGIHQDDEEEVSDAEIRVQSVAESMLDKRFQARFRVASLVLSNWRAYFFKLLEKAFPEHRQSEYHSVYSVYYLTCWAGREASPTPRDLKIVVNQIGAVHRQWGDIFPLHHMAYYAILLRQNENVIEGLNSGRIPEPSIASLVGGCRDNLAAMWFNVPLELARQIRLKEPIISALSRRQVDRLHELVDVSEGFWAFLETLDFTELATDGRLRELANAAYTLKLSDMLSTADTLVARSIIRGLRDAFLSVEAWAEFDTRIAEGIGALFQLTYDEKLKADTLSAISAAPLRGDDPDKLDKDRIHAWIDGLVCLLEVVRQLEPEDRDLPRVQVHVSVDGYIEACAWLYAQDPEGRFWNCIAPKFGSGEEIANALNETISSGEFGEVGLGAVRVLRTGGVALPWETVVSSVKSPLSGTAPVAEQELTAILATLWNLRKSKVGDVVDSELAELVQQGRLLHHFQLAKQNRWCEEAAWLLFWYLEKEPGAPPPPQVNQAVPGHNAVNHLFQHPEHQEANAEITKHFLDIIEETGEVELIFTVSESAPRSIRWIEHCLRQLIQGPCVSQLFSPRLVLERWDALSNLVSVEESDHLLAELLEETSPADYIGEEFEYDKAGLYAAIVRSGGAKNQDFRNWCLKGLRQVPEESWKEELSEEGDVLELVIDILDSDYKVGLGVEFQDALLDHAVRVIEGQIEPERLRDCWALLPQALRQDYAKKTLRRQIVEAAVQKKGQLPAVFFDLYGDEISDKEVLAGTQGVVLNMFTPLLEAQHPRGIQWIADVLEKHRKLLSDCGPKDVIQDFRDRIKLATEKEDHLDEQASLHISRIARHLGL